MWVDTHCHLFDRRFTADLDEVLARARAVGVSHVVVPGVDLPSSRQAVALAERYPEVYAAVGIHPEALADFQPVWLDEVRDLASHPKVVAIGEIGLDYYWNVAPSEVQRRVFRAQLELAGDCGLPAVVHNRDATADVVADVLDVRPLAGGVMHCFTADADTAQRCVRAGFWISYGGPLT
ncbi:MAG: TatD family hydrolase, partial [Alicyclobacillus sp.]|nr:TatD family hydrolase [Alicyclobacillus sp.]